ncbi:MAG: histidine phosphatase family protein [Pseudonocardiaceae bacterium]
MITVVLVRHADIDLPPASTDPPLNSHGHARAEALAHVAGAAGVATVLHSPFLRTRQTVAPLAARLELQPREAPAPATLAKQVRAGELGEVILIAGHSNTVPQMIGALGVPAALPSIGEHEFDNLFVVAIAEPDEAGLLHLRYGPPST